MIIKLKTDHLIRHHDELEFLVRWSVDDRSPIDFVRIFKNFYNSLLFIFISSVHFFCVYVYSKSTWSISFKFLIVIRPYNIKFPKPFSSSWGHRDVIQAPFCENQVIMIISSITSHQKYFHSYWYTSTSGQIRPVNLRSTKRARTRTSARHVRAQKILKCSKSFFDQIFFAVRFRPFQAFSKFCARA